MHVLNFIWNKVRKFVWNLKLSHACKINLELIVTISWDKNIEWHSLQFYVSRFLSLQPCNPWPSEDWKKVGKYEEKWEGWGLLEIKWMPSNNSRHMGSSCPSPFLSDGMFVSLSREDCKMEHRSWMRERRILRMELGSLQERCIRRKEQRSRMLGIQNSRKGSSCPCPCSSSPSDGRFCCMHKRRMVLRRKVRGLRNCQLVLHNCQQEHRILEREQRTQQMELRS